MRGLTGGRDGRCSTRRKMWPGLRGGGGVRGGEPAREGLCASC
jgi:hypothetical protein